nr:MAG TPA: hypothetical protein [Caudoviricetes sp.]
MSFTLSMIGFLSDLFLTVISIGHRAYRVHLDRAVSTSPPQLSSVEVM